MKKQWSIPTMSILNVSATKEGTHETTEHDATTYDSSGKWWAGGYDS